MPIFTNDDYNNQSARDVNRMPNNYAPVPTAPTGVSLMRSPNLRPMELPSIGAMCCPGRKCLAFTTMISLVEVAVFIATLVVGALMFDGAFVQGNTMLGPSPETLKFMGGTSKPDILNGEVWRLLSPIVLHAGVIHIASNIFFQMRFGYALEARWGWHILCLIYFVTGLGGCLLSVAAGPMNQVSVGASGALFGMLGADLTYLAYNWVLVPDNTSEACFLCMTIVINVLFGISGTVDKWAHLGGFLGGIFFGFAFTTPLVIRDKEKVYRICMGFAGISAYTLLCLTIWIF